MNIHARNDFIRKKYNIKDEVQIIKKEEDSKERINDYTSAEDDFEDELNNDEIVYDNW